jgi:hypothetical protein
VEKGNSQSIAALLGVLLLLGVLSGLYAAHQWVQHRRAASDRNAQQVLWFLASADGEFRAMDRDGNGIQDYWTGDVAGLYKFGLIPREIAEADAAPLVPLIPQPIPYKGCFFRTLRADESETPPAPYQEDTDGRSGKVHSRMRFGFVAYPAGGMTASRRMWIINENHTPFGHEATSPPPQNWPPDPILRTWSKIP